MPEIITAKTAGFCFGVKRAIEMAEKLLDDPKVQKPIYTYGPIIHNDQVVEELASRGAIPVGREELDSLPEGSVILVRSHGIGRDEQEYIESLGLRIEDATCPFVKKIHNIVRDAAEKGENVVIVGDPGHPEVRGIRAWSGKNTWILPDIESVSDLPELKSVKIVAQTTFNCDFFEKIVENIKSRCYDTSVMNTICSATQERQQEARSIASRVDAMIVVGGRHSSNSQKLFQICRDVCEHTFFVEKASDLGDISLPDARSIGITAGASTPGNIIREVLINVRTKF